MDIIRMTGGLGNQMFQYALYLKLRSLGRQVKFDDRTEYEGRQARPILLWVFDIAYPAAAREEINRLTDGFMGLPHRIRRRLSGRRSLEYQEKKGCFDEQVFRKDPAYLTGYFQSERYFSDIEDQVREAFQFSGKIFQGLEAQLVEKIRKYQAMIEKTEAVSVHIRRGDYLENGGVYGGICTEDYYKGAVALMRERFPDAVFYLFSNEPGWAKEWAAAAGYDRERFVVIEGTSEDTGYLDLYLMSRCRHHIIANSSFSWWGAWLNPDRGKVVIAPSLWVNNRSMEDIYTREMVRLSPKGKPIEEKLISVIVAAYNIEDYLPRCLDSLRGQTYEKLEIIVVDDGSEDSTGEICDRYGKLDSRFRIIHQQNQGLSGARNAGLAVAGGDYIGYVDGDDWVEPEMYRAMLTACEEREAQMAVCAYRQVGSGMKAEKYTGERYFLSREEALDIYICDNRPYHIYNSVWSKLFRRDIVEGMRFSVGRKSEDIMYTTCAMINAESCVFLDTPYYNYVVDRADSIMNEGLHHRRFYDEIPFWEEQIACLKERGFTELSDKAFYYFCRRMLFYYEDFRDKGMNTSCREMIRFLKGKRELIKEIYSGDLAARGDKVRMQIFLLSPGAFYHIVKAYERLVLPLRQSKETENEL